MQLSRTGQSPRKDGSTKKSIALTKGMALLIIILLPLMYEGVASFGVLSGQSQITHTLELSAVAVSFSEIDLSWEVSLAGVSRYDILRNGVLVASVGSEKSSYRDRELAPSTTYVEKVVAVNPGRADFHLSGEVKATTLSVPGRSPGLLRPSKGAVVLSSKDHLDHVVQARPAGTVFYLEPGVYRLTRPIVPKTNDVFEGAPGAILNGSRLLTSFERAKQYYSVSDVPEQHPARHGGSCDRQHPMCTYAQDLYFDNRPLRPVSEAHALGPGRWYFDRKTSTVYLYDNPAGHKVEIGLSRAAFDNPRAEHVTIRDLTVEKFANQGPFGAIGFQTTGPGWVVENNNVQLNHGSGININSQGVVRGNYAHDNGEEGITGGNATDILVENNEMSFNNYAGYDCGWECGGMKFGSATELKVVGNYVHNNLGIAGGNGGAPGLWCDVDCMRVTFRNNVVQNNGGSGIFYEISHRGLIVHNVLVGNGGQCAWGFGAGIAVNESDHVKVYGNLLVGNHNAIVGVQQNVGKGPMGFHELADVYIHDNIVVLKQSDDGGPETAAGIFEDDGDRRVFLQNRNRFVRNTYRGLATNPLAFQWLGRRVGAKTWRQYGNDKNGFFKQS